MNGKKAIGLDKQNKKSTRAAHFFVPFFSSLSDVLIAFGVEMSIIHGLDTKLWLDRLIYIIIGKQWELLSGKYVNEVIRSKFCTYLLFILTCLTR